MANAKRVALPAAAQHMSQQALDHLPTDHFVFDTASLNNSSGGTQPIDHVPDQAAPHVPAFVPPVVTLPEAAQHMSQQALDHLPTDHFVFDTASLNNSSGGTQPIDHVPDQAAPHVPAFVPPVVTLPEAAQHMSQQALDHFPADHFVFGTAFVGTSSVSSQPIDHVPEQAAPHVPEIVPPDVPFPNAAVDHMSDVAKEQLAIHADWLI